jgi:hypothetical protein
VPAPAHGGRHGLHAESERARRRGRTGLRSRRRSCRRRGCWGRRRRRSKPRRRGPRESRAALSGSSGWRPAPYRRGRQCRTAPRSLDLMPPDE